MHQVKPRPMIYLSYEAWARVTGYKRDAAGLWYHPITPWLRDPAERQWLREAVAACGSLN